ncbi:MAG: DnaA regulatory inactivator Hda [Coxiellaceae bacterium]|nr:DnaA regulatory inactivator Hda [Coxiellaceae bacterium]
MLQTLQLPLHLPLRDDALFDNFFPGKNAQVIAMLATSDEPFIYCYGESGAGRTHLLQAACHAAESHKNIFYLPLTQHKNFSAAIFDSLETQDYVYLDDIDCLVGDRAWEEALFYFYNRARENNVRLIMSATLPPQQLSFLLPDLQSRLSSALILEIKNLSDNEKIQALKMRAHARGLLLSDDVANYFIHHCSRNMRHLMELLSTCDKLSLITKRKVTIPFVKEILDKKVF